MSEEMSLFEEDALSRDELSLKKQPLADRIRPDSLNDFDGKLFIAERYITKAANKNYVGAWYAR